MKFLVKIRGTQKIEKKKRIASTLLFLIMKTKENIQYMCQKIPSKDILSFY